MNSYIMLLGLSLWGCGTKAGDTSSDTATEDTGEPTVVNPEDTAEPGDYVAISGTMNWGDGSPAEGADVQVCASLCRRTSVQSDGSWELTGLDKEAYIVLGFVQGDASITTTVSLVDMQEDKNIGAMTLKPYATQVAFTAGMHEYVLDGGLHISFNSDDISSGLYSVSFNDMVSSLKVDGDSVPHDLQDREILGMWMLGDFDYHVSSGISWRLDDTFGLDEGASIEMLILNNEAHAWDSLGTFPLENGAFAGGDATFPYLSTIVMLRAE